MTRIAGAEPGTSSAAVEGTVNYVRPTTKSGVELELVFGTNRISVEVEDASGNTPMLSSRVRVRGGQTVSGQASALTVKVPSLNQIEILAGSPLQFVKSVVELRRMGAAWQHNWCVAHLEGLVLAASPGRGTFALQDDTGVALLEIKAKGQSVTAGQKIVLEGNCLVEGDHMYLCDLPMVDNNDIHAMTERTGLIYLKAGKHPFRLAWFNQEFPYGLEVYYQGADLPRQKIPDAALFRLNNAGRWTPGLDYGCYEGNWLRVPDFDRLVPAKTGTATNFDLNVCTRVNKVGLQFTGFVEVPREGMYTFSTISDDGSLMFIDEKPPWIEVTRTNAVPDPLPVALGQNLGDDQEDRWSQLEGTVTFASEQSGELELELSSDAGRMRVVVADSSGGSPEILLRSRIRATGICLGTRTTDGQKVAGKLLTPGMGQIEVREVAAERWSEHPVVAIASLDSMTIASGVETIARVRGNIRAHADRAFYVTDATGFIRIETSRASPPNETNQVELLGRLNRAGSNLVLQCCFYREIAGKPGEELPVLPLLTTVEQIKRLTHEQWQRGYPVKIRGVVTTVLDSGFFIQDSTRSIYVRWQSPTDNEVPRVGDYWEVEGKTFAEFAPNIQASRATRLDAGTLPEPLHPTWDQLINGSLDTGYVEVQGIVTAVEADGVSLLTRAGKIRLLLPDVQSQELQHYQNALIRVRGCAIPVRDIHTQQVQPGQLRLSNVSITVDEPAPSDPFAAKMKHIPEMLLFDWRAGALQRVKVGGQILHARDGEYYLMDGADGLRFFPKGMVELQPGDLVEVVGFAELGGLSPVLREAVVRRTGHALLPEARLLPANAMLNRRYDATLVRAQARLASVSFGPAGEVLELQAGTHGFMARLKTGHQLLRGLSPGSLVELTGVYAGQGSDLAPGRDIDSFELLLNSEADVKVLARPSWWTVRHTLTILGSMACVILVAVVWIALLRRQVEERSNQLADAIRRHELTERQRELEEERTRIAHDLHDDLGATLTQIRFLSVLESRDAQLPETTRNRMGQVSEKSREMVASLDEIVWAVNPANDSLPNLANYLCHFAEEFSRSASIRCRLDVDDHLPPVPLTSEVRHNLYLAVREAMNNIAKHSQATQVWLRIHCQPSGLGIIIEDNGCGFTPFSTNAPGDGLVNMRARLQKIGGRFECEAGPGGGVVCRLFLPLEFQPSPKQQA